MSRRRHGFLHDEQGDRSTARLLLWVITPNILALIWVDVLTPLTVPATAYALLGTMFSLPCIWAMGRAAMRYLGPQLGAMIRGIGSSGPANDGAPGGDFY